MYAGVCKVFEKSRPVKNLHVNAKRDCCKTQVLQQSLLGVRRKGLGTVVFPLGNTTYGVAAVETGGKRMSTGHSHWIVRVHPFGVPNNKREAYASLLLFGANVFIGLFKKCSCTNVFLNPERYRKGLVADLPTANRKVSAGPYPPSKGPQDSCI